MARVYRRRDRRNEWWIEYRDAAGKQKRERAGGTSDEDKDAALELLATRIAIVRRQKLGGSSGVDPTFRDMAGLWMDRYAVPSKKAWVRDDHTIRKHLLPVFGDLRLSRIDPESIERWKAARAAVVAKSTVNREIDTLKAILRKAVDWGYLVRDPARTVRKFRIDNRRLVFLEADEVQRFLAACPGHLLPAFATMILTGLRKSECLNLTWEQLDLRRRLITLDTTKSGRVRVVPVPAELVEMLSRVPRTIGCPYVFSVRTGPLTKSRAGMPYVDLRKALSSILAAAGIEKHVTLHTLRHTYASHLAMAGVDPATIAELLGHRSLDMVRRYTHLSDSHKAEAVSRLGKLVRTKTRTSEKAGNP